MLPAGARVRWKSGGKEKSGVVVGQIHKGQRVDLDELRSLGSLKINKARSNKARLIVRVERGKPGATPRIYGPTTDRVEEI